MSITSTMPVANVDDSSNGRRLILAIRYGVNDATRKFVQPVPRFAHFAAVELRPTSSNIETE